MHNEVRNKGNCENTRIGEKQSGEKLERKGSIDIELGFKIQTGKWEHLELCRRWENNNNKNNNNNEGQ